MKPPPPKKKIESSEYTSMFHLFFLRSYQGYQRDWISLRNWVVNSLPSSVVALTNFDAFAKTVLDSSVAWVVDFYAPWCRPCQTFASEYELASKRMDGRIKFAKVDCDRFYQTCIQASVHTYPTVRFYR